MLKHFAKTGIARLWMVVLLASLSMVTVWAVASAVKIGDEHGVAGELPGLMLQVSTE
jgi:hypothetical protein